MRDTTQRRQRDYLARSMKQCDLNTSMKTDGMYVPKDKTFEDMPADFLRRNLCHKAQGDLCICVGCEHPCAVGKILRRAVKADE